MVLRAALKIGAQRASKFCLLGLSLTVLSTGCSTLQKGSGKDNEAWSLSKMWKKEYQIPQQMAVIWSPDVLTVPGKPPTRGFGGRVFFYNERSQAIPVEGEMIVHGYLGDPDAGAVHEQADKTFVFTAEQLTNHFSPSQLGASYSIWIPWDDARGYQKAVNLIPTFKTKQGLLVQGAPAKLTLPGKSLESENDTSDLPVQTISFQQSSTPTNNGVKLPEFGSKRDWDSKDRSTASRMRTTTIEVPREATLARRKTKERLTLELGAAKAGDQPTEDYPSSSGVSVGGESGNESRSMPTGPALHSLPGSAADFEAPGSDTTSSSTPEKLPAAKVRSLPAPSGGSKSPFAYRPLPKSSNFVRQASFFEKQKQSNSNQ